MAVPSTETGLGGTYTFATGYNADGSIRAAGYPQTGDLPIETVRFGYTDFDQPATLMDSYGAQAETSIVSGSQYDALAHATQYTLYTGFFSGEGSRAYLNFETDQTTGRLKEISVHRDGVSPNTVTDAAIGWTGVGAVACGALAGAAGSMVQYAVETEVEHKGNVSLGGTLLQGAIGGIAGGLMGGLGSIAGQAVKAGASSLISGGGAKVAMAAGRAAAKKEAGATVGGLSRNAFTKSASQASEGAASRAGGSCLTHSFAPTTAVLMSDGTAKPISSVTVGDKVLATDPATGKRSVRTVQAVLVHRDTALTNVTVKADGRETVLYTTQHRPFWSKTKERWVNAGDLAPGEELRTSDGRRAVVKAVDNSSGSQIMYDLTVDEVHIYFVLGDNTAVLVHNCGEASDEVLDMGPVRRHS